jgi:hypothetical protein
MFTFYDNLYGFEEKVWNLCYNEILKKWITFYSWVPSYSENIYNQYFSFDRDTSKWITKLGISNSGSDFADGVVLSSNVIDNNVKFGDEIGTLDLANRTLPTGTGIEVTKSYELVRDNFGNWEKFDVREDDNGIWKLYLKDCDAVDLCSEFYKRKIGEDVVYPGKGVDFWKEHIVLGSEGSISKNDCGKREWLDESDQINGTSPVYLLNIRCNI